MFFRSDKICYQISDPIKQNESNLTKIDSICKTKTCKTYKNCVINNDTILEIDKFMDFDIPINYFQDKEIKQNDNSQKIKKININIKDPISSEQALPENFEIKTLNLKYINEIHKLIVNHYVEDEDHIVRLSYSVDFIYWYLKYIPPEYIIGLTYKNKLVGIITVVLIDMIIYNKKNKIPYIDLLCIQKKIRKIGLAKYLINEVKKRIMQSNISYGISTSSELKTTQHPESSIFCKTEDYIIPINYKKLKKIGFLVCEMEPINSITKNPLHLVTHKDISIIVPKLNKFMERLDIKPYFTLESAKHFLLPKKNIVYSFVNYDQQNQITDFISVYINYFYCIDVKKFISVAQLAFYFYESMNISELVSLLIDKLSIYKIDQLIFRNVFNNTDINITKFSTKGVLHYYFYNMKIKEINPSQLAFFPF